MAFAVAQVLGKILKLPKAVCLVGYATLRVVIARRSQTLLSQPIEFGLKSMMKGDVFAQLGALQPEQQHKTNEHVQKV